MTSTSHEILSPCEENRPAEGRTIGDREVNGPQNVQAVMTPAPGLEGGRAGRRWWRWILVVTAALALCGVGLTAGALWLRPGAAAGAGHDSSLASAPVARDLSVDMSTATTDVCQGPAAPGPGHPDPVLSQIFHVADNVHSRFLLGWQVVPYSGAGSYRLGTQGNLLALEPPTSGAPLGYASGTLTVAPGGTSGSVNASVKLTAGGTMRVRGAWSCGKK